MNPRELMNRLDHLTLEVSADALNGAVAALRACRPWPDGLPPRSLDGHSPAALYMAAELLADLDEIRRLGNASVAAGVEP